MEVLKAQAHKTKENVTKKPYLFDKNDNITNRNLISTKTDKR